MNPQVVRLMKDALAKTVKKISGLKTEGQTLSKGSRSSGMIEVNHDTFEGRFVPLNGEGLDDISLVAAIITGSPQEKWYVKLRDPNNVYLHVTQTGSDGAMGGSSWSSSQLTAFKVRELDDETIMSLATAALEGLLVLTSMLEMRDTR